MRPPSQHNRSIRFDRWWMAILIFGFIRSVPFAYQADSFSTDPDAYLALAVGWEQTGIFSRAEQSHTVVKPTAYRPPLYPWILSWFVVERELVRPWLTALHVVLGSSTALLAWLATQRLLRQANLSQRIDDFADWRSLIAAWIVGLCVAIDPILVRQSTLIMTETPAAFGAMLVWWLWIRLVDTKYLGTLSGGLLLGCALGANCLLRASNSVWLPLILLLLLVPSLALRHPWFGNSGDGLFRVGRTCWMLLVGWLIVVGPWALRNRAAIGDTVWFTTHGGYTLLLANNPILFDHFQKEDLGRVWDEERFHRYWENQQREHSLTQEVETDRFANQLAWATIRERPSTFMLACFARLGWFWAWWPSAQQASLAVQAAVGTWYAGIFGLSGWSCFRFAWSCLIGQRNLSFDIRWIPAVALILGLTTIHMLYWSNMRMRGPIMPMIYMLAVLPLLFNALAEKPNTNQSVS